MSASIWELCLCLLLDPSPPGQPPPQVGNSPGGAEVPPYTTVMADVRPGGRGREQVGMRGRRGGGVCSGEGALWSSGVGEGLG